MSPELIACALLILAYLLGSVSAAIVVCRALGLPDPRTDGSRNPGTTNVLRLGGKPAALMTLAGDMIKGVLPVLAGHYFEVGDAWLSAIGFAAFIGHLYPVFFGFEGGKGVATALGVLVALHWPLGLAALGLWLAGFGLTRISSVGALTVFVAMPILSWWWVPGACPGITLMSAMLLWRHRSNIQALVSGTERSFRKP